jgi:hypothetical protein
VQLLVLLIGLSRHKLDFPLPIRAAWSWLLPVFAALVAASVSHSYFLANHTISNLVVSILSGALAAIWVMSVTRKADLAAFLSAVGKSD